MESSCDNEQESLGKREERGKTSLELNGGVSPIRGRGGQGRAGEGRRLRTLTT